MNDTHRAAVFGKEQTPDQSEARKENKPRISISKQAICFLYYRDELTARTHWRLGRFLQYFFIFYINVRAVANIRLDPSATEAQTGAYHSVSLVLASLIDPASLCGIPQEHPQPLPQTPQRKHCTLKTIKLQAR